MNRVTRDYCSKNFHPRWKAWRVRYDMTTWRWKSLGNLCVFCGGVVIDPVASGGTSIGMSSRMEKFLIRRKRARFNLHKRGMIFNSIEIYT